VEGWKKVAPLNGRSVRSGIEDERENEDAGVWGENPAKRVEEE